MRAMQIIAAGLAGALLLRPAAAQSQVSVSITVGAQLGPPVPVYVYSAERYGPWREDWDRWTPVVLFEQDGRFYRRHARGMRAVEVYVYGRDYFLPPQDRDWVGYDRRYDYRLRPGREQGHERGDDDGPGHGRGRDRGRGHGDGGR